MQRLLNVFTDQFFLIDLVISVTGLVFMCALTYAMRWLPGKASEYQDSSNDMQLITVLPETEEIGYDSTAPASRKFKAETESKAVATTD